MLLRGGFILFILYCFSRKLERKNQHSKLFEHSAEEIERKETGKVFAAPFDREDLLIKPGQLTLSISIISNNRFASLKRLLNSLQTAEYSFEGNSLFSSIDIYFNLEFNTSTDILEYVLSFDWPHGGKLVRKRIQKGGLIRAVSESWYPSSRHDFGLILEDDIEVSTQYLRWITKMLWNLHINPDPRVVGISLYSPKVIETTSQSRPFNSTSLVKRATGKPELPYLFQTPCSWGALYFPLYWSKFIQYMQLRLTEEEVVEVPNSRTNGWKASWKKYFFELLHIEGKFLLYPNFLFQQSFSTNHMEVGEHIKAQDESHSRSDYTVPLLHDSEVVEKLKLGRTEELPSFNFLGEAIGTIHTLTEYLMAITSKQNVAPSDHTRNGDTLRISDRMRSDKSDLLLSKYGGEYQCVLQADGNLVIYFVKAESSLKKDKNEKSPQVMWSSGTFITSSLCSAHVVQISIDGRLEMLCEKMITSDAQSLQSVVLWSSPSDPYGPSLDGYHLRIESTGALILYRGSGQACASKKVVWRSDGNSRSQKRIEDLRRCDADLEMNLRYVCDNFPKNVAHFLRDETKVTLMISFYSRYKILLSQIKYYSASPLIVSIIVTWHNNGIEPPSTTRVGNSIVYFITPDTNSLNNRFNPDERIYTDCVLVIDDDMKIHLQDIYNLFEVWKRNRRSLVGFSPRWYDRVPLKKGKSILRYRVESEDPPQNSKSTEAKDGYGIMLTKSLMLHRDFLYVYSCGGQATGLNLKLLPSFDELRHVIRAKVRKSLNCEDIGMNFIAAALLHGEAEYAPPLFVEPIHRIGDFGKLGAGSLHKKKGHEMIRSECLNTFNEIFAKVTGEDLPLSKRIITSSSADPMISRLRVKQYTGKRKRVHDDCFALALEDPMSGCSFVVPHNVSYNVVWA